MLNSTLEIPARSLEWEMTSTFTFCGRTLPSRGASIQAWGVPDAPGRLQEAQKTNNSTVHKRKEICLMAISSESLILSRHGETLCITERSTGGAIVVAQRNRSATSLQRYRGIRSEIQVRPIIRVVGLRAEFILKLRLLCILKGPWQPESCVVGIPRDGKTHRIRFKRKGQRERRIIETHLRKLAGDIMEESSFDLSACPKRRLAGLSIISNRYGLTDQRVVLCVGAG